MPTPKEILITARTKKGFTQESLAAKLEINLRTIQRYEEGKFPKYKSENIESIDKLLGTNLCDIIYDKEFRIDKTEFNEEDESYGYTITELLASLKKEQENLRKEQDNLSREQENLKSAQQIIQTLADIIKPPNLNNAKNG